MSTHRIPLNSKCITAADQQHVDILTRAPSGARFLFCNDQSTWQNAVNSASSLPNVAAIEGQSDLIVF